MRKKIQGLFFLLFIICFWIGNAPLAFSGVPEEQKGFFTFGGRPRTYFFYVPASYNPVKAIPLVIVLHGGGGNARGAMRMSQMNAKADQEGFIAVYPNGTGPLEGSLLTWNAWNCCGSAVKNQVDDVGFIRAVIEKLEKEYAIDPKRIYATGFSNGGMMAYRLGCELSDKIAAIAPVSGAMNAEKPSFSNPVSVIIFHGTEDQHVLYDGGSPKKTMDRVARVDKPVSYPVSFWAHHDYCQPIPKRQTFGHISHETYTGGIGASEVELYTIQGQGHAWPGGASGLRFGNIDEPTKEISATDIMWAFFKKHPKPNPVDNSPYAKWVHEKYL